MSKQVAPPSRCVNLTGITWRVASGGLESFAVRSDGTLFDWGDNATGELGNGTTTSQLVPEPVPGLAGCHSSGQRRLGHPCRSRHHRERLGVGRLTIAVSSVTGPP